MRRTNEEVAIELLEIDWQMWRRLCSVDADRNMVAMGNVDDLFHGIDDTQHVAHMCDRDELRLGRDECLESVDIEG